jgi:hypothetical protein
MTFPELFLSRMNLPKTLEEDSTSPSKFGMLKTAVEISSSKYPVTVLDEPRPS